MKNIFSRNSYLLGLFALLIISPSYGQFKEKNTDPTAELSYVENSKKASHYYLLESYRMALQLYLQLHKSNPEDLIINYRTGICYLNTTNKSNLLP